MILVKIRVAMLSEIIMIINMLAIIMLSIIMLSIIMLRIIMLSILMEYCMYAIAEYHK